MDKRKKLLYFRYFFCGRGDVYAWRIPSGKKAGQYVPLRTPRYSLTDSVLASHMRGDCLLGAYPMLENNLTHWVAADFDGKNDNAFEEAWKLKEVLEFAGIQAICNTSQSGRGVHVRVVFQKMLPAWQARGLMIACIERENIRSLKEGGAFDRLFPAQDELDPRNPKAIGNQIGMPLNRRVAEDRGGCVLLDKNFDKIGFGSDVWDYLGSYECPEKLDVTDALQELGRYDLLSLKNRKVFEKVAEDCRRDRFASKNQKNYRKPDTADLGFIYHNCEFMKHVVGKDLSYNEWWALGAILTRFDGCGGRRLFHIISCTDSRYDVSQTDKKYNELLAKIKAPVKCSTLATYGFVCPMMADDEQCDKFRNRSGRGPRTPANICYFVNLAEVNGSQEAGRGQ